MKVKYEETRAIITCSNEELPSILSLEIPGYGIYGRKITDDECRVVFQSKTSVLINKDLLKPYFGGVKANKITGVK